MPRGKPRDGSKNPGGRPKGSFAKSTLESMKLREYIVEQIELNKGPIIAALIRKAKAGNPQAIQECLNRSIGKVTETIDVNGNLMIKLDV